jgi:hypothetical protein
MTKEKTVTLFTYGSIILPSMTNDVFGTSFIPVTSVFIKGYKLTLKHANSKKYPAYHNIICEPTGNVDDMIPGFTVEVPYVMIGRMDTWEGSNYRREKIVCFDRNLKEITCEIYSKK